MKIIFELEHLLYTLALASIGYFLGAPILAAWSAVIFFIGREHAQAEYKWINRFGDGKRANMPWWATLDIRVWDFHSWFWNLLAPILLAITITVFI